MISADSWRNRQAKEQARRRDTNDSIEHSIQSTGRDSANMFFCECGDTYCDATLSVTIHEFTRR